MAFAAVMIQNAECAVKVNKKLLFLTQSTRSVAVTISNPTEKTLEIWLTPKFGYIVSKDSGEADIYMDTTGTPPQSAAGWIDIYPKRFRLGPLESQVVRLTATPPPALDEGEYWSRIYIASQDVNPSFLEKKKSGFMLIEQLGIPFHYRKGLVTTGLDITNLNATAKDNKIFLSLDMTRTGNASFWGSATIRIFRGPGREMIFKKVKDIVVYTKFAGLFTLNQGEIPSGKYNVEIEFKTDGRSDIKKSELIQSESFTVSRELVIE